MQRVALGLALMLLAACHSRTSAETARNVRRANSAPLLAEVDFVQLRWASRSGNGEHLVDPTGTPVVVSDTVVLDLAGMDSVFVSPFRIVPNRWDVVVRLSRAAAASFGASSAMHIGQQLAIIVDHHIVALPLVTAPLGAKVPVLSGVPRSTADSLAARIDHAITLLKPWQPVELHRP